MALSPAAEEAFNAAVEAAYAMQEPGLTAEDRKLAEKAYIHHMEEYYLLNADHRRDQWWAIKCRADPSAARCRLYDV